MTATNFRLARDLLIAAANHLVLTAVSECRLHYFSLIEPAWRVRDELRTLGGKWRRLLVTLFGPATYYMDREQHWFGEEGVSY